MNMVEPHMSSFHDGIGRGIEFPRPFADYFTIFDLRVFLSNAVNISFELGRRRRAVPYSLYNSLVRR
ncbi:MAG: hypothetical protein II807_06560, partial [Thermoguttaceae bacterium]|nr:hypothetical protein [Thermoguttaceae bacterium]